MPFSALDEFNHNYGIMKCPDCLGKGFWMGVMHRHECESCDSTGEMDPEKIIEASKDDKSSDGIPLPILDDDTEPLFALTLQFPMLASGAGGDTDSDDICD